MLTKRCIHNIRRKYLYEVHDGYMPLGLLAFAILLRVKLGDHSCIGHFSINRIVRITGCSWATCDKYIRQMLSRGFATMDGETLLLRRLSSGTRHRNVPLASLDFRNLHKAKYSLRSLMFMLKQNRLDMVERSIRIANNPKRHPSSGTMDDFKAAKAFCKKYAKPEPNGRFVYYDFGIAYRTIAKAMACSKTTAVEVIKFAIRHRWLSKFTSEERVKMEGVGKQPVEGYTFTTANEGVKVYANSYELNRGWYKRLMDLQPSLTRPMSEEAVTEYYANRDRMRERMHRRFCQGIHSLAVEFSVSENFVLNIKGSIRDKHKALEKMFGDVIPPISAPTSLANIETRK